MSEYTFRMAREDDRPAIVGFVNTHWDNKHPLVNLPDVFDYYYKNDDNSLNFALAEEDGILAALAGFVRAGAAQNADAWVSLWVADKAARGSGLQLMDALPALLGVRTLACNNIRPETRPFYEFLGFTTGRIGHFYRLAHKTGHILASVPAPHIPPATGDGTLTPLPTFSALLQTGFVPPALANPYKDLWYLQRRYYNYPHQKYTVYAATLPGQPVGAPPAALLVARVVPVPQLQTAVFRIVDFVGEASLLPHFGAAIDALLHGASAEYAECYCAGVDEAIMLAAGFVPRIPGDGSIIPNYLTPPLRENTDYYYFTSNPAAFTMFRADGDQDRPNLMAL